MMKLKEFMIRSPTGKTHAINPKTNKTYCGHPQLVPTPKVTEHTLEDLGWRYLDVLPSDQHEPTCHYCKAHYDDPLKRELESIANELKEQINEFLFLKLILKDVGAIGRFVENIAKFMRAERKRATKKRMNGLQSHTYKTYSKKDETC